MVGFAHDSVAITFMKKLKVSFISQLRWIPRTIEYITSKRTIYRTKNAKNAISHGKTKTGMMIKTSQCVQLHVLRYTTFKNIFPSIPFYKTLPKHNCKMTGQEFRFMIRCTRPATNISKTVGKDDTTFTSGLTIESANV